MFHRRHDPAVAFLSGEVARKSDDVVSLRVDCELLRERVDKAERAEAAERRERIKAQKAAEDAEYRLAEACKRIEGVQLCRERENHGLNDQLAELRDARAHDRKEWEAERAHLLHTGRNLNDLLASREATIMNMQQSLAQLQSLAAGLHQELGEAYALGDSIAADLDHARAMIDFQAASAAFGDVSRAEDEMVGRLVRAMLPSSKDHDYYGAFTAGPNAAAR